MKELRIFEKQLGHNVIDVTKQTPVTRIHIMNVTPEGMAHIRD
jgi:hypothetical protein